MEIENGKILVMVALPDKNDANAPPGYVELYRIDGILQLQEYQGYDLSGHPGRDLTLLPGTIHQDALLNTYAFFHHNEILEGNRVWACTFQLCKSDIQKVKQITDRGDMVAVWFNRKRNRQGQTIRASVQVTWRKRDNYLNQEQRLWLRAYSASGYMLTGNRDAARAIQNVYHWIGEMAKAQPGQAYTRKQKPKQKNRRLKRKQRRKQEQWTYDE